MGPAGSGQRVMTMDTQNRGTPSVTTLATIEGAFEALCATADTIPSSWLAPVREKAFKTFLSTGFPGPKDEDWKYTSLVGFAERSATYLQNRPGDEAGDRIGSLLGALPLTAGEIQIVFVNGRVRPDLSNVSEALPGLKLLPYSAADASTGEQILRHQPIDHNAMIALNWAFLSDGLAIHIEDGAKIEPLIHVIFLSDGQPTAAQPRLSVDIGRNSEAVIVQHHAGLGEGLTNAVTSINCAEHARLFFVRLQNESTRCMHVANQIVRIAADGYFDYISIDLGSQMCRNDIEVDLHGKRAHASLHGLFVANGQRHIDNHLRVDHRSADTTSLENYRGILDDAARGVFNGKIIVHSGADGTDAQMSNRNLLLSEQAEIDTKPELEIYTDDVKCAHGSTTGQLDQNAMFYLRARGVPETTARLMLVGAFAREIIDHVRSQAPALADYLIDKLDEQLPLGP